MLQIKIMKGKIITHVFNKTGIKGIGVTTLLLITAFAGVYLLCIWIFNLPVTPNQANYKIYDIFTATVPLFFIIILYLFAALKTRYNISFLNHIKKIEFQKKQTEIESVIFSVDEDFFRKTLVDLKITGSKMRDMSEYYLFHAVHREVNLIYDQAHKFDPIYNHAYKFDSIYNQAYEFDSIYNQEYRMPGLEFVQCVYAKQSFKLLGQIEYSWPCKRYYGHMYLPPRQKSGYNLRRFWFTALLPLRKKLPELYLGQELKTGKHIIINEYELGLFNIKG